MPTWLIVLLCLLPSICLIVLVIALIIELYNEKDN